MGNQPFTSEAETARNGQKRSFMPFHGGNTGSNPVGDANIINDFPGNAGTVLAHFCCAA